MTKPTWDQYFLNIAQVVATRSSCERAKVGAVIVKDNRIIGTGYNDAPAGRPGCESCPRRLSGCDSGSSYDTGATACVALHAELNAILNVTGDISGGTLYVTKPPCDGCWKIIAGSRLKCVTYRSPTNPDVLEMFYANE